jgi:carboxypeptidase C (cathepsin A)
MRRILIAAFAFFLCGPALADSPPPAENAVTTAHSVTIGGKAIAYKAVAGNLILRDGAGTPTASVFYVAYVAAPPKGTAPRPVTFLFNGGPGSASLWLHMSGLGPVTVHTNTPKPTGPAPYDVGPSSQSLLDKSDLVFIDAVGTGFSHALGDTKPNDFWGVDQDTQAFTQTVTRYLTVNKRWGAPKFLFGESYGTTRAAALAYALQNRGVQINGVVLLSSILDFSPLLAGQDQASINALPTFAMVAAYHGRSAYKGDQTSLLRDVKIFARGPYAAALAKGDDLSPAELDSVAQTLSSYTGLPVEYLKRVGLRIDMETFRRELLKDQSLITGRFDARFKAQDSVRAAGGSFDPATDDPATQGVSSAYLSAFQDYLAGELGYASDTPYLALNNMTVEPAWDWHHKAPGFDEVMTTPNTALDLAAAMRFNPQMKVLSMNGLYDMATPFFGTENDLSHMLLTPALKANITLGYYASGHMTYADPDALKQMKTDLATFYDTITGMRP